MKPASSRLLLAILHSCCLATAVTAAGPELRAASVASPPAGHPAAGTRPHGGPELDPSLVVGPSECGDCHESAFSVWENTAHARGYHELTRTPQAAAIASALGIRRIKRDERCTSCHFLPASVEGSERPIAGVACESCHGAGRDWIDVHWDYGKGADAGSESSEHRQLRVSTAEAKGMIRPERIDRLASRCYDCHVMADAELVELGGHPQPPPVDLASATQDLFRHNFVREGPGVNAEASPQRRRLLHALGRLLELEHRLRALAAAGSPGPHATAQAERARELCADLRRVFAASLGRAELDDLERALPADEDLRVSPDSAERLGRKAKAVRELAHELLERHPSGFGAGTLVATADR